MNNKNVKMPGFIIYLAKSGQLDEAFRILQELEEDKAKRGESDEELNAKLEGLYKPYRDSFGAVEPPTFDNALSELVEFRCRLIAPLKELEEANVTAANDRDADSDGDESEEPAMNAEAKAALKESVLMLIDAHNDVVKALRSKNVKFDAVGVQWVLSVLLKVMNVGALLSGMARTYGLSAECVRGAGNILVDWEDAYKDARLVRLIVEGGGLDYESFDPKELAEALTAAERDSESD